MNQTESRRILITGGTGCVGQYLVEELLAETPHRLVLVVRNRAKLPAAVAASPRVEVVDADMADVAAYKDRLGPVDTAILVAAGWGGEPAFRINRDANLALTDHLVANGGRQVFYFATGSVIDADSRPLAAARDLGTDYVRSKYELVEQIEKRAGGIEIVGLFPTLVVGGGDGKPMSHFANLLHEVKRWAWLLRFLRAEGKFHYVHARDIARTTRCLLAEPPSGPDAAPRRLALGNPAVTANGFIADFCRHLGYRMPFGIPLTDGLANAIIKIFRIQMSAWDRYCVEHRDLSFRKIWNPTDFGLPLDCPDVATLLTGIGIPARR